MAENEVPMAKVIMPNGKEFQLEASKLKRLITQDLFGKSAKSRKAKGKNLNGAKMDLEGVTVEKVVSEKHGEVIRMSCEGYETREFPVDFITNGCELVAKEQWAIRKSDGEINQHAITGTRFVLARDEAKDREKPFGENIAKLVTEAKVL